MKIVIYIKNYCIVLGVLLKTIQRIKREMTISWCISSAKFHKYQKQNSFQFLNVLYLEIEKDFFPFFGPTLFESVHIHRKALLLKFCHKHLMSS